MTRERVIGLLPILKAYSEGKDLQCRYKTDGPNNPWVDALYPTFSSDLIYRVKPEPKYIPFTFEDALLFKDKWVEIRGYRGMFKPVFYDNSTLILHCNRLTYLEFLDRCTFEDGKPCGKLVTV